jgi:hypothetical protein
MTRNSYAGVDPKTLKASVYNPNQLSAEQQDQLFAEVKHQERLLKPIVVHDDNGQLIIVDGEQNWAAALRAGLTEVPIEIIDADEFEARRQTYVRNLSGDWHKVKLGRMFVEMLNTLVVSSNRELAVYLGITEGTVRNMILYSTAARLAAARDDASDEDTIAIMTVREVRKLLAWLRGEADEEEGDQPDAAEPEARILARLKRAWNKATEQERAAFLQWTGYVTVTQDQHQVRNSYAEPADERQVDIEDLYPEPAPEELAEELADEQAQPNDWWRKHYAGDPIELGRQVRALRKGKGWSQAALAEAAGTHAPIISQIENGKLGKVGTATLQRVVAAVEV